MRKEWFAYVKKIREKENRLRKRRDKKAYKPCTHKEAMSIASTTWSKHKDKLLKQKARAAKITAENATSEEVLTV